MFYIIAFKVKGSKFKGSKNVQNNFVPIHALKFL